MSMNNAPIILSVPAFSEHMGWKRTYGYQLKKEGRLVMAPDGKNVLVAESIALHAATRDLPRQGVADRHAAARSQSVKADIPVTVDSGSGDLNPPARYDYQDSKAKKEHFAALEAEASYRAKIRDLLDAGEVRSVLSEVMTVLRTSIEGLPYIAAPILAATSDEAEIKSFLHTEVECALNNASEALAKLGRGEF